METTIEQVSDYELERGKPMPSTLHSYLQKNLVFELELRYRKQFTILPELSLDLPGKPAVPDITIYPRFEIDFRHDVIKRTDAPLTTVEILSPTQSLDELIDKANQYFQAGVKSCWIVLPSIKAILVYNQPGRYHFFNEADTLNDPNLNLELPLADIFK